MTSGAVVSEFQRMAVKLGLGETLTREEQLRVVRFAIHRARQARAHLDATIADSIGPDLIRVLHDPRMERLHFSCALMDADCGVLASFEGDTDLLEPAEDLVLAAINGGGTGQIHMKPND